jgi:hypothetical protein
MGCNRCGGGRLMGGHPGQNQKWDYAEIADIAVRAHNRGERMAAVIAEIFDVTEVNARTMISKCRDLGFPIPASSPGAEVKQRDGQPKPEQLKQVTTKRLHRYSVFEGMTKKDVDDFIAKHGRYPTQDPVRRRHRGPETGTIGEFT